MKEQAILLLFFLMGFLLIFGCISFPAQSVQEEQQGAGQPGKEAAGEAVESASEAGGTDGTPAETTDASNVSIEEEIKKTKTKEISFTTKDRWLIYGDLYYAEKKSPEKAIVLLHQLGMDRKSYSGLIPVLQESFPDYDIVALDLRGHGKSTNLGSYSSFTAGDYRAMKNDLEGLKTYFSVSRPTIKEYYIVGASIGGSIALDYASKDGDVKKLVMISPGTSYREYDITKSAENYLYTLCLAAGFEDRYSSQSAQEIYDLSPSDLKQMKIYYGTDAHGIALLDATKTSEMPLQQFILSCLR